MKSAKVDVGTFGWPVYVVLSIGSFALAIMLAVVLFLLFLAFCWVFVLICLQALGLA